MSVYRSKNSPFFEFDFQWKGQRFHGSTKKKGLDEALAVERAERKRVISAAKSAEKRDGSGDAEHVVKEASRHPVPENVKGGMLRTPKYAAALLGCSLQTVLSNVRAGRLKYVQVGHGNKRPRRKFRDADLYDFIERQTKRETPTSEPDLGPRTRRRSQP